MVSITVDHIPQDTAYNRRPGNPMQPTSITIHSTGNETAKASGERKWLVNPSNKRSASYHYVVDESICIEAIPANENAWHAGDGVNGRGNRTSIGIEMVHEGDRNKVLQRTKELTVQLMIKHGITKIVRHYDWTKKNCPAILNKDGKWTAWDAFHADIMAMYKAATEKPKVVPVSNPKPVVKTSTASYVGKRVESIYKGKDGINFYSQPSFDEKDKVGVLQYGYGFDVVAKVSVDGVDMYKVQNSKGEIYYITAYEGYVKLEGETTPAPAKKPVKKPVVKPKPVVKKDEIKAVGTIEIVGVKYACYILDKPSASGNVLATINKSGKIQISGSVPGWFEVIYNGRRAYINEKYGKRV